METLLTIPLHLLIFFQDIRERKISVYILVLLLASILILNGRRLSDPEWLNDILFNELMLALQLMMTILAIKLLKGRNVKVIDNYLGLGDIVLLAICGLCFRPDAFFVFYIFSLVLGISTFLVIGVLKKPWTRELPFAAIMSFVYVLLTFSAFTMLDEFAPFRF